MPAKIRKDDQVMVMSGRSKGKTGKVIRVIPAKSLVVVEKVNVIKKHQKPNAKYKHGGIIEKEAPLSASSVRLLCGKCKGPVRVGIKSLEDGGRVRYCKKCKEVLDK